MLGIQEMVSVAEDKLREVRTALNAQNGIWHPEIANIYGTGESQKEPLSTAKQVELHESLRKMPLSHLLEFLHKASSGTFGGTSWSAAYLVPDKLYDNLIFYSDDTDKVPIISAYVAERWDGADLRPAVVNDETYKAQMFSSGGSIPIETIETKLPTLSPVSFGIPIVMGLDLIEDGQWDLVEFHTRQAAKAMGRKGTSLALDVLRTATDGWGTVNSGNSGDGAETRWIGATTMDIADAIYEVNINEWKADTVVTTAEPWNHSICRTFAAATVSVLIPQTKESGFDWKVNEIDILLHTAPADLTSATSKLQTIVYDRKNALLTGRKRWMQIENYSNPMADLGGAIVTARQDSVTLYNDAICVLAET